MSNRNYSGTLTIRLGAALERRLAARARETGATPSAVAREALEASLGAAADATLGERTRGRVGVVASRAAPAGRDARKALATWRPDRRG